MPKKNEQLIVGIVDENEEFETTYYDITNMSGELKDFYGNAEQEPFKSYEDYVNDMTDRGAEAIYQYDDGIIINIKDNVKTVRIIEHKI